MAFAPNVRRLRAIVRLGFDIIPINPFFSTKTRNMSYVLSPGRLIDVNNVDLDISVEDKIHKSVQSSSRVH